MPGTVGNGTQHIYSGIQNFPKVLFYNMIPIIMASNFVTIISFKDITGIVGLTKIKENETTGDIELFKFYRSWK